MNSIGYFERMGRRLSRIDLFHPRHEDSWIVLLDPWWNVQGVPTKLPGGSDLLEAYLTEMLRYHREGWTVHEFSSISASFFVTKGDRRGWHVTLTQEDPERPRSRTFNTKPK